MNQNRQSQHQNILCFLAYSDQQNNQIQWRSQGGGGGGNSAPLPPKCNYTLYRGLWRATILSPPSLTPEPPLLPPHFEKSGSAQDQILKSTKDIAQLHYKPGTDHGFKRCEVASVMVLWFIRKTVLRMPKERTIALERFFVFLIDFKLVLNVHILCITKILI